MLEFIPSIRSGLTSLGVDCSASASDIEQISSSLGKFVRAFNISLGELILEDRYSHNISDRGSWLASLSRVVSGEQVERIYNLPADRNLDEVGKIVREQLGIVSRSERAEIQQTGLVIYLAELIKAGSFFTGKPEVDSAGNEISASGVNIPDKAIQEIWQSLDRESKHGYLLVAVSHAFSPLFVGKLSNNFDLGIEQMARLLLKLEKKEAKELESALWANWTFARSSHSAFDMILDSPELFGYFLNPENSSKFKKIVDSPEMGVSSELKSSLFLRNPVAIKWLTEFGNNTAGIYQILTELAQLNGRDPISDILNEGKSDFRSLAKMTPTIKDVDQFASTLSAYRKARGEELDGQAFRILMNSGVSITSLAALMQDPDFVSAVGIASKVEVKRDSNDEPFNSVETNRTIESSIQCSIQILQAGRDVRRRAEILKGINSDKVP